MATFNSLYLASNLIPNFYGDNNFSSGVGFGTMQVTDPADAIEFIYQMPEAATITDLGFSYAARGAGTVPAHQISLQGVDTATGRADGTIKSSGNAKGAFTPPASSAWDGTYQTVTLTASYAAAAGEYVAVVIAPTGTPSGGAFGIFNVDAGGSILRVNIFPYYWQIVAGTPNRKAKCPVFGIHSASKAYAFPIINQNVNTYDSTSSPNEKALAFTLGNPAAGTYVLGGIRFLARAPATGKNVNVIFYTSGTTAGPTQVVYGDVVAGWGQTTGDHGVFEISFPTPPTCNYGTQYRIGFQPTAAAALFGLQVFDFASATHMTAFGGGSSFFLSTRSGGAWTDVTTSRPAVDLFLADSTPSGGGGGTGISAARLMGGM